MAQHTLMWEKACTRMAAFEDKMQEILSQLDEDALDELVYDRKAAEAAALNNAGQDDQVEYLIEWHGEESVELLVELTEILKEQEARK